MKFHDVVVSPFTDLLEEPRGGLVHRGGPHWPDFSSQTGARHRRRGQPADVEPQSVEPVATIEGPVAWGGPLIKHYGHAVAEFSMRLVPTLDEHGQMPFLFATKPALSGIHSLDDVPAFQRAIWEWLGVSKPMFIKEPTLVRTLVVEPQAEVIGGPGPSEEHLDRMDALVRDRLRCNEPLPAVYVSRAGQEAHIAGEEYIEQAMTAAGALVVRPERIGLMAQLHLYAAAKRLILSEGSAVHTLQLLGRLRGEVTIILRRHRRSFARYLTEPRTRSLRYIDAVADVLVAPQRDGVERPWKGLAVLDADRLGSQLQEAMPEISFLASEFRQVAAATVSRTAVTRLTQHD